MLAIERSWVQLLAILVLCNVSGQVVHTCTHYSNVPLSVVSFGTITGQKALVLCGWDGSRLGRK